jgi:hypothetical protein
VEVEMTAKAGDRIVVESEHVGQPTREGEIVEIIEGALGVRYRVRWEDGHGSVFSPSGGSARIIHKPARRGKTPR